MNRLRLSRYLLCLVLLAAQIGACVHALDFDAHAHGDFCAVCAVVAGSDDAPLATSPPRIITLPNASITDSPGVAFCTAGRYPPFGIRAPPATGNS